MRSSRSRFPRRLSRHNVERGIPLSNDFVQNTHRTCFEPEFSELITAPGRPKVGQR